MDTQQLTATPLTTTLRTTSLQATGLQTVNPLSLTTQSLLGASQATHTFTVTNISDSGAGSLRQAILDANADTSGVADVINFNLGVGTHTITLTSANLDITAKNLTINGTGADNLSISGGHTLQDFKIEAGSTVTLAGLSITQGTADKGGGILNNGTLTLNNDIFESNYVYGSAYGGAINNNGVLTINNSLFDRNSAIAGGAISNSNQLTINGSTFTNNLANAGGGIFNNSVLTVYDSTFTYNQAVTTEAGGAIYNNDYQRATLNASNLTFAYNKANDRYSVPTVTYNHDIFGSFHTITVDSLLDTSEINFSAGHVSLREAIAALAPGGTINFASNLAGGTIILNQELDITKNLTIQGLGADRLTISGNNQVEDFYVASGVNATISGLTITKGFAANGGGILNNGTLTLTSDNFTNNMAMGFGGAVNNNGALTINTSTFDHNSAAGGGAIGSGNQLTVNGSTFTNNSATDAGGAIDSSGTLTVNGSTFTNNIAVNSGGGIFSSGLGSISGSTFTNNIAQNGGAIDATNNLTIANSAFTGNQATTGAGGAILIASGTDSIMSSTFTNNTAQSGGAIKNAGILMLTNDTITGNKALNANGVGGGIWNNGRLTLEGDIITGNSAVFEGGGVFNAVDYNTANTIVIVHNTTIQNNTAIVGPDFFGSFVS